MDNSSVCALVVTYNRRKTLTKALKGILNQEKKLGEYSYLIIMGMMTQKLN